MNSNNTLPKPPPLLPAAPKGGLDTSWVAKYDSARGASILPTLPPPLKLGMTYTPGVTTINEQPRPAPRSGGALTQAVEALAESSFVQGVRQGALLDDVVGMPAPKVSEIETDAEKVERYVGMFAGAVGEGLLTQSWMLRGLQAVAAGAKSARVGQAARYALDKYLTGQQAGTIAKIFGNTVLQATTDAGLMSAAGKSPTEIGIATAASTALGGAASAAVGAARLARNAPGMKHLEIARDWVNENLRYEYAMRKYDTVDNSSKGLRTLADDFHAYEISKSHIGRTEKNPAIASTTIGDLREDFLRNVVTQHQIRSSTFQPAEIALMKAGKTVELGGQKYAAVRVQPSGPQSAVLQVLTPKNYGSVHYFPEDLAKRLTKFIYEPYPEANWLQKATAEYKRNTIWWGLANNFTLQLAGDALSLVRSNPKAFLHVPAALRAQFANYGTPLWGARQAAFSAGGGVLGGGLTAAVDDDATLGEIAAGAMLGMGLGYAAGTKGVAGQFLDPATGRVDVNKYPALARWASYYDEADAVGAVNSGMFAKEVLAIPNKAGNPLATGVARTKDTLLTLLRGTVHGNPNATVRGWAETAETVMNERENLLRLASYIQQVERGVAPKVAGKRAAEALVDYGRFTEFENKYLRGALLPFYSFARHNIANWVKTAVGKDVGGYPQAALMATGAMAGFAVAAQAWNRFYFGKYEDALPEHERKQFHLIMGNPLTGEVFRDTKGRVMVVGVEMPYEQALEFLGLGKPGGVVDMMAGTDVAHRDLVQLQREIEDAEGAPTQVQETLKGVAQKLKNLVTPALRIPYELTTNKSLAWGDPIVPPRLLHTPEAKTMFMEHVANSVVRQYQEVRRADRQGSSTLYGPVGLGLPVRVHDIDREMLRRLDERFDAVEPPPKGDNPDLYREIASIVNGRADRTVVGEDERTRVETVIRTHGKKPGDYEAAWRFYWKVGTTNPWQDRVRRLDAAAKAKFYNSLSGGEYEALVFYANGGKNLVDHIASESLEQKP